MRSQPRSWISACCSGCSQPSTVGLGGVVGNHCGIDVGDHVQGLEKQKAASVKRPFEYSC
jgi:hypothetical protein